MCIRSAQARYVRTYQRTGCFKGAVLALSCVVLCYVVCSLQCSCPVSKYGRTYAVNKVPYMPYLPFACAPRPETFVRQHLCLSSLLATSLFNFLYSTHPARTFLSRTCGRSGVAVVSSIRLETPLLPTVFRIERRQELIGLVSL